MRQNFPIRNSLMYFQYSIGLYIRSLDCCRESSLHLFTVFRPFLGLPRGASIGCWGERVDGRDIVYVMMKNIQSNSEEVNNLGDDITGLCEKKNVNMNTCVILNGYPDGAVWISGTNSLRYLFVGLDEEWRLNKKADTQDELLGSHSGCCFPDKEKRRRTQKKSRDLAHKFQSSLRLMVGFSNIYFAM